MTAQCRQVQARQLLDANSVCRRRSVGRFKRGSKRVQTQFADGDVASVFEGVCAGRERHQMIAGQDFDRGSEVRLRKRLGNECPHVLRIADRNVVAVIVLGGRVARKELQKPQLAFKNQKHVGMGIKISLIRVLRQRAEHAVVAHVMPVYQRVGIQKIRQVPVIHEQSAHPPRGGLQPANLHLPQR